MPSEADITAISCLGLAENYLDELAAQLGKTPAEIDHETVKACLKTSLRHSAYTQTFYDDLGHPRAVFGLSPSGCVTYVETKGLTPMTRAKWARANKDILIMLKRATGVKPWCYSDARNGKATRLLEWFKFKHIPQRDIIVNGYAFKYYEHTLPVAE